MYKNIEDIYATSSRLSDIIKGKRVALIGPADTLIGKRTRQLYRFPSILLYV